MPEATISIHPDTKPEIDKHAEAEAQQSTEETTEVSHYVRLCTNCKTAGSLKHYG